MDFLEEVSSFVASASTLTLVKLIITAVLPIVTVVLWKRLRPPEDRGATSKARDVIHVRTSDEETEDEAGQSLGLMAQLKSAELRKMEQKLSLEQREKENEVQKQQLAAIFELLQKQQQELNAESLTEDDFNAQLKLYR
ncbi:matrix-remodeling-associated protein 7 [Phlebotomus argentipes]|uniref:matrix-remodeling-associated protein 7 n=1 Tax=Phlebotomus argentipes TaxID=94469 RepID=UPI0028936329|nr:matrix-remodeling-associated protein 7 [Phlebotomus argentipes]